MTDVAIKVTYNDGNPGAYVGFKGVCSSDAIRNNIKGNRVNCGLSNNPCRIYFNKGMTGKKPIQNNNCYEASLFVNWEFGAGMFHSGKKKGTPIPILRAEAGDIAVLTTKFPGTKEAERKIVGLYRIKEVDESRVKTHGHMLVADDTMRIEITKEVADHLNFWEYYSNFESGPRWNTGLFRYLKDEQTDAIINDVTQIEIDTEKKKILDQMLKNPSSSVYLKKTNGSVVSQVISGRKYGPSGEGPEHLALKNWVADNPSFLGLPGVEFKEIDTHIFPSNDRPDIVFKLKNGDWATVEIETDFPFPGAYQAIKYKSLLCAEQGFQLDSDRVKTFLVAYGFDSSVRTFCKNYKVTVKEKRL